MKFTTFKFLLAIVMLGLCQTSLADDPPPPPPPYSVWFDCDADLSFGNPALEPFKGKSKAQMVYLGNEEFCYRVKFKCDKGLTGGFNVDCFCDLNNQDADGGVGVHGAVHSDDGFCAIPVGFFHLRNNEFDHACSFDGKDASVRVEAVEGSLCSDLPDPVFPPP